MLIFLSILIASSWIIYVRFKLDKPSIKALVFKIITTVLILMFALFSIIQEPNNLYIGILIVIGLVFGLIGDVVLDLKLIYPKESDVYTFLGFGAFILGHLIYIGYFLLNYHLKVIDYSFIFGLSGAIVFIVLVTETPMKLNFGKFRIIVSVYAFILSLITFLVLWTGYRFENLGFLIFGIGLILFLISDLILSHSYFGKKEKKWMIIGNYAFYYSAQFLIALSILYV